MENYESSNAGKGRRIPLLFLLAFLSLGTWARVTNAGGSASLWYDEAWRIQSLLDAQTPFRQMISSPNHIDPPVFNLAIYLLARIHNIELVLRLASIIPGVLAILAAYLVGRQLFTGRWTALLAAFLVAFSPWLTIFSKELKPYSLGLLVHLSVLYGVLRYQRRPERRWEMTLAVTMVCALFFSPNIVFSFPGICILMLVMALETGKRRRIAEAFGAVTAMLAAATLYYLVFLHGPTGEKSFGHLTSYWHKYFCPHETVSTAAGWFFRNYMGFYQKLAFTDYSLFKGMGDFLEILYPLMVLAGAMIILFRCRHRFLQFFCLFLMPVLVMVPFNLLTLWPFGPLRMNLFLMAYVIFPPLFLLDEWQRKRPAADRFLQVGLVVAILMALQFPAFFSDYASQRPVLRTSGDALINITEYRPEHPPIPLLVNRTGLPSFSYYSRHHKRVSKRFRANAGNFEPIVLPRTKSRLYPTGLLLRKCQEHREVAVFTSHYGRSDRVLFRNDFSTEHHSFHGRKVHSCILTSEIAGYEMDRLPLFSSRQFTGESRKWEVAYISPPLHGVGPGPGPAPGALIVVNFDLSFNSGLRLIRFRFFDQDVSRKAFRNSSIQNGTVRIPEMFESAVHTLILKPVESVRLVISARGSYDFTMKNVNYVVTRPSE